MRSHLQLSCLPVAFIAAGIFLLSASPTRAADDSIDDAPIDQIVVVAHKDERSVRDIAANVTVLSRADLNCRHPWRRCFAISRG